MARANAAYYATHDPFRDFVTSPEISQVFGELLGAWTAIVWESMGRPSPVILAELGPGRGTLMTDALRTIRTVAPACAAALCLHLVETSPRLRAHQASLAPIAWHDDVAMLPPGPLILLANEFLDALPIRQFICRPGGWTERFVDAGAFVEQPALLDRRGSNGDILERNEAAERCTAAIATRLVADGGAALFLDYGADAGGGDTLQAIRGGAPADPIAAAGEADLTAHVDFAAISRVATEAGATVYGPVPQGLFLARLGLFQRTDRLARALPPARASAFLTAAQRLAEPMHMGKLFKAMVLTHPLLPEPPGFSA